MKKIVNKKDIALCVIICGFYFFLMSTLVKNGYMYGSTTDWSVQHWAIPEYFRMLFFLFIF